jgi:hypothetical protein
MSLYAISILVVFLCLAALYESAQVEPAGRLSASFSILSIAAPELKPAAFSPWISKAGQMVRSRQR